VLPEVAVYTSNLLVAGGRFRTALISSPALLRPGRLVSEERLDWERLEVPETEALHALCRCPRIVAVRPAMIEWEAVPRPPDAASTTPRFSSRSFAMSSSIVS